MSKHLVKKGVQPLGLGPTNLNVCLAMIDANIDDPNSQEGIDFCTDRCPYDKCDLFESGGIPRVKSKLRAEETKVMLSQGEELPAIANHFGVSVSTIRRDLKYENIH